VGGQLTIDGAINANGGDGLQDNSGGGSGGSILITARSLTGNGTITANGGQGELFGGGGGGGGAIALYSPTDTFRGGFSTVGGMGAFDGANGTVFISGTLPPLRVIAQTPQGIVSNLVGQVTVQFNARLNPASLGAGDVRLITPNGPLGAGLALAMTAFDTLQITFPPQNLPGNYRVEIGPGITNLLGQAMSQVYTGAFTIVVPVIAGTITDTNGQPVAGVTLHQDNGSFTALTDAGGAYTLGVAPGWSGNVVPSLGSRIFAPYSRGYANVTGSISNQNYVAATTLAANLTSRVRGTNFAVDWFGIGGVTYELQYSTNLMDWAAYPGVVVGTNGPAEFLAPIDGDPQRFIRLKARN
jgi:hypothetical protein